jgi:hypothetical protein
MRQTQAMSSQNNISFDPCVALHNGLTAQNTWLPPASLITSNETSENKPDNSIQLHALVM